jgi:hypothetical protein
MMIVRIISRDLIMRGNHLTPVHPTIKKETKIKRRIPGQICTGQEWT